VTRQFQANGYREAKRKENERFIYVHTTKCGGIFCRLILSRRASSSPWLHPDCTFPQRAFSFADADQQPLTKDAASQRHHLTLDSNFCISKTPQLLMEGPLPSD
jgi:hypothetical protein